jgi:plasmid stabilization system protein ParE
MTPVRYHVAAEDELLNEIGYLELHVPGLGRRFYAEIRKAESLIAQFPESAEEVLPGNRKSAEVPIFAHLFNRIRMACSS